MFTLAKFEEHPQIKRKFERLLHSKGNIDQRRQALRQRFHPWRPISLDQLLREAANLYPDRPFVITDDQSWTYQQILNWSEEIAAGLLANGVEPGDHVALLMANYPEFVAVKFAIARVGAVAVPINFLNRKDELGYVLKQSDAVLLVVMQSFRNLEYLQFLDQLSPGWATKGGGEYFPKLKKIIVFENQAANEGSGYTTLNDLKADKNLLKNIKHPGPNSNCDIIYTSGTTGDPKGVMLTHDMMIRTAFGSSFGRAFEDGRRILFSLPMYHVYGYVEGLLASIFVGGSIVVQTKFDAASTLQAAVKHSATDLLLIPTMTLALIDELKQAAYNLENLHAVISSGGRSPSYIWKEIYQYLQPVELTTGYGMTEVTASSTVTEPDDSFENLTLTNGKLRNVGPAGDPSNNGLLVNYRVVDPGSGLVLPLGQIGELQAKGVGVTAGYYNKPEATQQAFTADGWLHTGDLGKLDENGYLTLMGRTKESYRCGGEQVLPSEIEDLLVTHPAVLQAHVVPVPDERMGEVGVAYIVLRASMQVQPEELTEFCSQNLARFKVPRHFLFITAENLPTTPSGRARKFLLVRMAMQTIHPNEKEKMNHTAIHQSHNPLLVTVDTPVGYQLQSIKKRAVIQLMGSRLWGRFNPNHWDPEYAKATGLANPIQTGEMSSAYLAEMCVNHFGAAFFRNARIVCKYVSSTIANEVITTHGIVRSKEAKGNGYRFTVDIWADNENGDKKTVGWIEVDVGV